MGRLEGEMARKTGVERRGIVGGVGGRCLRGFVSLGWAWEEGEGDSRVDARYGLGEWWVGESIVEALWLVWAGYGYAGEAGQVVWGKVRRRYRVAAEILGDGLVGIVDRYYLFHFLLLHVLSTSPPLSHIAFVCPTRFLLLLHAEDTPNTCNISSCLTALL